MGDSACGLYFGPIIANFRRAAVETMVGAVLGSESNKGQSPDKSVRAFLHGRFPPFKVEIAAVVGTLAIGLFIRMAYGPHVRDDAYITLRYAEHLSHSLGFTFNQGERVLGTTTPLYTILLAVAELLGIRAYAAAMTIGIAADIGVMILLWVFGRKLVSPVFGILVSLTYSLLTPTVVNAVSGMETTFYLLAIMLTFVVSLGRTPLLLGFLCGITVLIRPDGLIVPAALVMESLSRSTWVALRQRNPRLATQQVQALARSNWPAYVSFALTVSPWVVFAWRYFGSPIPQSMVAKWNVAIGDNFTSVRYFISYFTDTDIRWFLPLSILAAIGIVKLRKLTSVYPLFVWATLYSIAFIASNKFVYPFAPYEWYFLPLLLAYSVAAGMGLTYVFNSIGSAGMLVGPFGRLPQIFLIVGLIAVSVTHLQWERVVLDKIVDGREVLYLDIARHVQDRYGARDDLIATPDIGAIGYEYGGPLLDLSGLVSPVAVGRSVGDVLEPVLVAFHPPWVVLFGQAVPDSSLRSEWFQSHYRPVFTLRNWESRETTLYRWYPSAEAPWQPGPRLGETMELVGRQSSWRGNGTDRRLHVDLVWRAIEPMAARRSISVQLFDPHDVKMAQQDNEPQENSRPTPTWKARDVFVDQYDLKIEGNAESRPQWLSIGGYLTESSKESLVWTAPSGNRLGAQLFSPMILDDSTGKREQSRCNAEFMNGIVLETVGISLTDKKQAELTIQWTAPVPIVLDYTVFVHARDVNGILLGQSDSQPVNGRMATSTWLAGERVVETRTVALSSDSAVSTLQIGLYLQPTGERLRRANSMSDAVTVSLLKENQCS